MSYKEPKRKDWQNRTGEEKGYLIFMARIIDPKLIHRLIELQRELEEFECCQLILPEYLHISIKDIGYLTATPQDSNDFPLEILPQAIYESKKIFREVKPFKFRLGRIGIFPQAVFVEIEEHGIIKEIQSRIEKTLSYVSFSEREKKGFLPHISIAYIINNNDLEDLRIFLGASWKHNLFFGDYKVDKIELVKIDDRRQLTYETLTEFRLENL